MKTSYGTLPEQRIFNIIDFINDYDCELSKMFKEDIDNIRHYPSSREYIIHIRELYNLSMDYLLILKSDHAINN